MTVTNFCCGVNFHDSAVLVSALKFTLIRLPWGTAVRRSASNRPVADVCEEEVGVPEKPVAAQNAR